MRKQRSNRVVTSLAGAILSVFALATAGCASSRPEGASSFAEEWQKINQGLRDGTPLTDRGQEIGRSLDSRFEGVRK